MLGSNVRAVMHQASGSRELDVGVDLGKAGLIRERWDPIVRPDQGQRGQHEQRIKSLCRDPIQGLIELARTAHGEPLDGHTHDAGGIFNSGQKAAHRRVGRVPDHGQAREAGHRLLEKFHLLAGDGQRARDQPGDVPAGMREVGHEALSDRICGEDQHNRDRAGRLLRGELRVRGYGEENINRHANELGGVASEALIHVVRDLEHDRDVAILYVAELAKPLPERTAALIGGLLRVAREIADPAERRDPRGARRAPTDHGDARGGGPQPGRGAQEPAPIHRIETGAGAAAPTLEGVSGSENEKVLPRPTTLSTQMRPPCSSTRRFASASPSPVPSLPRAVLVCSNSWKMRKMSSGAMPGPVSFTAKNTCPSLRRALTSTRPRSGVNFTAFDRRFTRTCFTFRSSASIVPMPGSMSSESAMECCVARSRTNAIAPPTASEMEKVERSSSSLPASTFDRSRMSLMSES